MKLWRVFDTIMSCIGASLSLLSGMFPSQRFALLLSGQVMKSVAGPLGGGARTALVLHLANYSVKPG